MKKNLLLLFLLTILCTSCAHSAKQDKTPETSTDTLTTFTLPKLPVMLNTPETRAKFLAEHYWEHMNFNDTNYIHHPEITEQAWVNYIDLLKHVPDSLAKKSMKQLYRKADTNKKVYTYFTDLADKYLYDPNSPLRNEEFYIPVLDAMLGSKVLSEAEKIRPQERRKLAERNRKGTKAINFNYTLSTGKTGNLYGIQAEYTLIFINNPGCHACEETIKALKEATAINNKLRADRLTILSIYPDEDLYEWKKHVADFPKTWIKGYDKKLVIRNQNLYDLKAIPTLYLLDKNKNVLLKDATVMDIDQYLSIR
ncbi:MAG: DUF5106 domain-containing protein [Bacteroides sp.]|jgi:hypothetical protein|nr:DUF5106 domain-containing protein [Bacteroides sp.]MCI1683581.1 DUF5106 domain-containing protein [Bacteroides sp.]